jgi:hypothetical protein
VNSGLRLQAKSLGLAVVACAILVAGVPGCTEGNETEPAGEVQLRFRAPVAASTGGEFQISLEVHNEGPGAFGGDNGFLGVMEIRGEDGSPRARVEVKTLGRLGPGETECPASWKGRLLPGMYTLAWGASAYGATTVTFAVSEEGEILWLGEKFISSDEAVNTALEWTVREAQALVELALADVAERLDVRADEIGVEGVEPAQFRDASLGAPEAGRVYAQVITPGYSIELSGSGEIYEYHGSGDRVVLVPDATDGPPARVATKA